MAVRTAILTINNSYSQLTGLTAAQFSLVRKELSYLDNPQAAYFSGGFQRTKYLIDKKGNFPTGLVGRVLEHLYKAKIVFDVDDRRKAPKPTPGMFKLRL